ncbi:hypothetical protein [Streptomyces hypolithicus]
MDFNITAEEEALVLRVREHLHAGNMPHEDELAGELGEDARRQVRRLADRGWLVLRQTIGHTVYVDSLSPLAEAALSSRRDIG